MGPLSWNQFNPLLIVNILVRHDMVYISQYLHIYISMYKYGLSQ